MKVCPMCGTEWPDAQKLIKCVTCLHVFCPACQHIPSVHSFECFSTTNSMGQREPATPEGSV